MQIIKSPLDNNNYEIMKLNNEMEVMFISNPNITTSHVAMAVGVGSLMNGKVQGLAHFLEHMLFMGSKKYPQVNKYFEYINEHGGSTNAYTEAIHTCYFFSIDSEFLPDAIDIFGHFFIDPLFEPSAVQKEINAIDSEYHKDMNLEGFKYIHLLKTLSKNHPFHNFDIGSKETLNIPNIRDELVNFYNTYYSSNLMKLIVLDSRSINDMKKIILPIFNSVKNNKTIVNLSLGEITNKRNIINIQSHVNKLIIFWEIPYNFEYAQYKPLKYIMYLLGRESESSLYSILSRAHLIESLHIATYGTFGDNVILYMEILLTYDGVNNYDAILSIINNYIKHVSNDENIPFLYNKMRKNEKIKYMFLDQDNSDEFVLSIIKNIFEYGSTLENAVSHDSNIKKYDKVVDTILKNYFEHMILENSNVLLCSRPTLNKYDKLEPWFKIPYNSHIFTVSNKAFQLPKLIYPEMNFIPNQLLLPKKDYINTPQRLNCVGDVFYFVSHPKLPLTCITLLIRIPDICNSVNSYVCANLLLLLMTKNLRTKLYDSTLFGYDYNIILDRDMYTISLYGFNDKIYDILEQLISEFFNTHLELKSFNNGKAKYAGMLKDIENIPPYKQIWKYIDENLYKTYYTNTQQLNILQTILFEDLQKFMDNMHHAECSLKCLINGYIPKRDRHKMCQLFSYFNIHKLEDAEYKLINKVEAHNTNFGANQVGGIFIPIEQFNNKKLNWNMIAMNMVINNMLSEKYFTKLRTEKQLGYIVKNEEGIHGYMNNGIIYQLYYVQSSNYSPEVLCQEIRDFLKNELTSWVSQDFVGLQILIQSCISKMLQDDGNLISTSHDKFTSIDAETYDFDYKNKIINALKNIDTKELKSLCQKMQKNLINIQLFNK